MKDAGWAAGWQRFDLLPVGGRSRGQFAQCGQESGGGAGIVHGIHSDGGGELRRFGTETDLKQILLPHGHQSVQFGRGIFLPMRTGG